MKNIISIILAIVVVAIVFFIFGLFANQLFFHNQGSWTNSKELVSASPQINHLQQPVPLATAMQGVIKKTMVAPGSSTQVPTKTYPLMQSSTKIIAGINVPMLESVTSADGLNPKALKAALNSYIWAKNHHKLGANTSTLTVIDFSLPSYEKRMWVLDLQNNTVLMKLYTTHGKGSGEAYATHFSNRGASNESSLGVYVTSEMYYGKHDKSMRVDGLEQNINNNARDRDIVIHSAYYATSQYIQEHHQAGRSWGCFAVAPNVKDQLLSYIKGGSVIFTYAAPEDHDPIVTEGPIAV